MKSLLRNTVIAATALGLSACGFHLRGVGADLPPLPFASVAVSGGGELQAALEQALRRDSRITVAAQAGKADVLLSVQSSGYGKDVLTINSGGKVNEYLLTYRVEASVLRKSDAQVFPLNVVVRRELGYSDSEVLGKAREEELLRKDMVRDAAEQLLTRMAHLPAGKP